MPESRLAMRPKYDAFISYSHGADGRLAPAVQKGLQRLGKPFYRLWAIRVFRDQTDLSASPGLWGNIETALRASGHFILFASQEAARSKWVRQELEYWLAEKDSKRILIVLTDGNIVWDDRQVDFDWEQTTALPRVLSSVFPEEPLWVDLCWAREDAAIGPRNPDFLKAIAMLSAPIRGMEFGQLISADRREHKRTMTVAWTAVILLIALTVSSVALFINARAKTRLAMSRLADYYWTNAAKARAAGNDIAAAHYFAWASRDYPDSNASRQASFNARALVQARLIDILEHGDEVNGALFYPDSKKVITWGNDDKIRLWSADDGRALGEFVHPRLKGALMFSGGERILSYGGNRIRLWNPLNRIPAPEELTFAKQQSYWLNGVTLSADERRILAWGVGGARLWDLSEESSSGRLMPHNSIVSGARFSRDEQRILSWDRDGIVKIWNASKGSLVATGPKHDGGVLEARFDSKEERVLSWSFDGTARLWSSLDGQELVPPLQHESRVSGALFNEDESRILTWSFDNTARLWNSEDGSQVCPAMRHDSTVRGATFRNKKDAIVTWSGDSSMRIWNKVDCTLTRIIDWDGPIQDVSFYQSGRLMLVWGGIIFRNGFVGVYDFVNQEARHIVVDHSDAIRAARLNSEQTFVLAWDYSGTVNIWGFNDGLTIGTAMQHRQTATAAFSPDERQVVTWSRDGSAKLWDIRSLYSRRTPEQSRIVEKAIFNSDGTRIVTWTFDGALGVWDDKLQPGWSAFPNGRRKADGAVFSRDDKKLLTWYRDHVVRLWQTSDGSEVIPPLRYGKPIKDALFADEEKIIIAWGEQGIQMWRARDGTAFGDLLSHAEPTRGIRLNSSEDRVLSWSDHEVKVWDLEKPRIAFTLPIPSKRVRGAWFRRNDVIVTWNDDHLKLWKAADGTPVGEPLVHGSRIGGVLDSQESDVLLSWGGKIARFWDTNRSAEVGKAILHGDTISGARFFRRAERVLTWDQGGTAQISSVPDGQPIGTRLELRNKIKGAAFSKDETLLALWDNETVMIWSAEDGTALSNPMHHRGEVFGAAFDRYGERLLTWGRDSTARLWNTKDGSPTGVVLRHRDSAYGVRARFSPEETYILTWLNDKRAHIWPIAGLETPGRDAVSAVRSGTGTSIDELGKVTVLYSDEWRLHHRQ